MVSNDEYKRLTGSSLEEFRVRMKQHLAETKKRVKAEKEKKFRPDD